LQHPRQPITIFLSLMCPENCTILLADSSRMRKTGELGNVI